MPIYEYKCERCKRVFERFQKISEGPIKTCPECGGHVKRLLSRTSFSLKGGGWYKDGYASPKPAKEEKPGKGPPEKGEEKAKTPEKKKEKSRD